MEFPDWTSKTRRIVSWGLLGLLSLTACGTGLFPQKKTSASPDEEQIPIDVDIQFTGPSLTAQGLIDNFEVTDFQMDIVSCKSGFTKSVTSTTAVPVTSVALYSSDVGCAVALKSFTFGGNTYVRPDGTGLSTGSAVFQAQNLSRTLTVSVFQNLPSPLVSGGKAVFTFQEVLLGADFTISNFATSHSMDVNGIAAPPIKFTAGGIYIEDINRTTKVPLFFVKLECMSVITAPNLCPAPLGSPQAFSNMKVRLVDDTYGGVVTFADAEAIMANGTLVGPAATLPASAGFNGGFSLSISGPGNFFNLRNLLLLARFQDPANPTSVSYRYFNIDIGTVP
jgi:hypothetical protein